MMAEPTNAPTEITTRRDPFEILRHGRLFDWLLDGDRGWPVPWGDAVPVDISRKDDSLILRASMPGFQASEIDVRVAEGVVSIRAEHKQETEEQREQYYRRERRTGYLTRSVMLPETVAEDQVTAKLKDGVLTITVPVIREARTNSVPVQAG
jgi:HSP20 family protein